MHIFRIGALALGLTSAAGATARAQDDWYHEAEGSSSSTAYETPQGGTSSAGYDAPGGAYAPDRTPGKGLGLGLKLGFGLPMGDAVKNGAFDKFTSGAVMTEFALNYGITPSLIVGGYVGLGLGILPSEQRELCDMDDVDCGLLFLNVGAHVEYRFLPGYIANPWLGGNFGMEWAHMSASSGSVDVSSSFLGFAFGPTVGVDFELSRWGIGPYLGYQAARFTSADFTLGGFGDSGDDGGSGKIKNGAFHGWLLFGARARYTFAN